MRTISAVTVLRGGAVLAAGAAGAYAGFVRPRIRNWGALPAELARDWPMDDAIPAPTVVTTRAITVAASPEDVWPWLPQMGELPRAGFYSHLSVERALGMRVHNAGRILPECQHPAVGDALDRAGNMLVKGIQPGEWIVLGPPGGLPAFDSTWLVAAVPSGDGQTRLVSRVRVKYRRFTAMNALAFLVLDFGQWLMERKMLVEIKKRAERLAEDATDPWADVEELELLSAERLAG